MSAAIAGPILAAAPASAGIEIMDTKSKGTVLVVGSNAQVLPLRGGRTTRTGNYLNETVIPMRALLASGYDVTVATPDGTKPALDMRSISPSHFAGDQRAMDLALAFFEGDERLRDVRKLATVVQEGLDHLAGVFVPGGHAPIVDLVADEALGEILRHAYAEGKPTAFLCHGPIASLAALRGARSFKCAMVAEDHAAASAAARSWQYRGYRMTIFSDSEEAPVEAEVFRARLPYSVSGALRFAGGNVEHGPDYAPFVVADRELITGQNPVSDRELARQLVAALDARATTKQPNS